jgi:N-acetylglucosaminyldiphosphoundecaprenol N-acetyl-beta-D-mannosaminyltransferase
MNHTSSTRCLFTDRPPIAILGVPFDNVTKHEAVALVESMIASRQPHYLVTPNVDFLVQARRDVELRRILFEAHLVLCDGTPLVWASRVLGNALPERVAGADLVPLLVQIAAQKKYRLFLLGAAPAAAQRAVTRLQQQYPELVIAGHYSPPFNHLLEMDHEEIKRRIVEAKPDLLFVSFGCPKQEKWVAMHYRSLGVPVTAGVGATIDFLAGQVKRAPLWMQRSGTEWIFRLAQEPRRLLRRYVTDLWVFGSSIFPQWWQLQARAGLNGRPVSGLLPDAVDAGTAEFYRTRLPNRLDFSAVNERASLIEEITVSEGNCLLEMNSTTFIDSTGVGFLIRLHKRLRAHGRELILLAPSRVVLRALKLMRLSDFFHLATNQEDALQVLEQTKTAGIHAQGLAEMDLSCLHWHGEVTAANAEPVWEHTRQYLTSAGTEKKTIDLRDVRFIDSSGLGLMVRAKKLSEANGQGLTFVGMRPAVRNVVRLSRLEGFLFSRTQSDLSPLTPVAG